MKYEIDVRAIKGKQGQLGISNIMLAKSIGIDRNTLANYYKKPEKMPFGIIAALAEKLEMNNEEARHIFFNNKLTQNAS